MPDKYRSAGNIWAPTFSEPREVSEIERRIVDFTEKIFAPAMRIELPKRMDELSKVGVDVKDKKQLEDLISITGPFYFGIMNAQAKFLSGNNHPALQTPKLSFIESKMQTRLDAMQNVNLPFMFVPEGSLGAYQFPEDIYRFCPTILLRLINKGIQNIFFTEWITEDTYETVPAIEALAEKGFHEGVHRAQYYTASSMEFIAPEIDSINQRLYVGTTTELEADEKSVEELEANGSPHSGVYRAQYEYNRDVIRPQLLQVLEENNSKMIIILPDGTRPDGKPKWKYQQK